MCSRGLKRSQQIACLCQCDLYRRQDLTTSATFGNLRIRTCRILRICLREWLLDKRCRSIKCEITWSDSVFFHRSQMLHFNHPKQLTLFPMKLRLRLTRSMGLLDFRHYVYRGLAPILFAKKSTMYWYFHPPKVAAYTRWSTSTEQNWRNAWAPERSSRLKYTWSQATVSASFYSVRAIAALSPLYAPKHHAISATWKSPRDDGYFDSNDCEGSHYWYPSTDKVVEALYLCFSHNQSPQYSTPWSSET